MRYDYVAIPDEVPAAADPTFHHLVVTSIPSNRSH
jgi:hypothetical protein